MILLLPVLKLEPPNPSDCPKHHTRHTHCTPRHPKPPPTGTPRSLRHGIEQPSTPGVAVGRTAVEGGHQHLLQAQAPLVASLLLVAMPLVPSSVLAPSSWVLLKTVPPNRGFIPPPSLPPYSWDTHGFLRCSQPRRLANLQLQETVGCWLLFGGAVPQEIAKGV